MKKNKKLIFFFIFILSLLSFSLIYVDNQHKLRKWELMQSEVNINSEELIKIISDAGYKLENKEEVFEELPKSRYGVPEKAWSIELLHDETRYTLSVIEYSNWKDASHLVDYWTQWYKDTSQEYKGKLFSYGNFAIFIKPPNIDLHNSLQGILLDTKSSYYHKTGK